MQNAQLEIPTLASAITVAVADNTALIALVLNLKAKAVRSYLHLSGGDAVVASNRNKRM